MDFLNISIVVEKIVLVAMGIAVWLLCQKVNRLTKRFEKHGHNTSVIGGTTDKPVEQKGVSFEQLRKTIQSVQYPDVLDFND